MPGLSGAAGYTAMEKTSFEKIRPHLTPVIVLSILTFAVYAGSLGHRFLLNWDDSLYVLRNPAIRGITWEHLKDVFTRFYVGNYAPLHIISYMFDYTLWGLNPRGFIFTNVFLHAANGLLFYFLLFRVSRRRAIAFLGAFIFLCHPVQVESVAWISERKNVLAMFFFLVSFHAYLSYRNPGKGPASIFFIVSVLMFPLAVLSKSVAIILPVVLFLYELCHLEGTGRKWWIVNKIPFLLIAAAATIIALKSQMPGNEGGRISYAIEGPIGVFYTMLTVLPRYLKLLFWPVQLSAVYMPPMKVRVDAAVAWSGLLALGLVFLGIYLYRKKREYFFWYALFFVGLIPVSQIVSIVTLMNDRYLYFPMTGAAAFYAMIAHSSATAPGRWRRSLALVLSLLVIPLPWVAWKRTSVWTDDLSLWADTARKTPASPLAWNGLGMANIERGRHDDAANAFLQALAIDPNYELALNNIGALYNSTGKIAEARPYLLKVAELFPYGVNGLMNLGVNYYLSGELPQAEQLFKEALTLDPQSADARARLGDAYLRMSKPDLAAAYYEEAIRVGGDAPHLEYGVACAEALKGHSGAALEHLNAALSMGYRDSYRIATDECLDSLRGLPDFDLLMRRYFGT
jgi:Flp pilus assembly protein TadD